MVILATPPPPRIPQEQLQNMPPDIFIPQCTTTSEAQCSENESDEDNDVEETKVQCPALFLPAEELRTERPETSVKIVELDDTYEEEFEERGEIVPYKVELADAVSQQSCTFYDYQNTFLYKNDIHQHHVFTKGKTDLLHLHLSNSPSYCEDNSKGTSNKKFDNNVDPDVYSPAVEKLGESSFSERHFKEKSIIDMECNQMLDNSCISFANKDSFPKVDLETPSIKEKLSQDIKESLEFSNFLERPNFEDAKTTESPLLLQEIALRNKPITEKYQGLERFFVSDRNERLNSLPSHSLERRSSGTKVTIAGDRDWIPDQSISACPNSAVASGAAQSGQNPSSGRTQQKMGKTSQRPSTANLPLSTSVKRSSNCNSSFYPPPRSAPAQSLSRAASEISEIEHIDITDHNEPFSDNTADQQTFDSLEKELNVLRNLAGASRALVSAFCGGHVGDCLPLAATARGKQDPVVCSLTVGDCFPFAAMFRGKQGPAFCSLAVGDVPALPPAACTLPAQSTWVPGCSRPTPGCFAPAHARSGRRCSRTLAALGLHPGLQAQSGLAPEDACTQDAGRFVPAYTQSRVCRQRHFCCHCSHMLALLAPTDAVERLGPVPAAGVSGASAISSARHRQQVQAVTPAPAVGASAAGTGSRCERWQQEESCKRLLRPRALPLPPPFRPQRLHPRALSPRPGPFSPLEDGPAGSPPVPGKAEAERRQRAAQPVGLGGGFALRPDPLLALNLAVGLGGALAQPP
ncbi:LOW QUALITY PROTEIN: hypothetical protein QTO34_014729 [Cnephaeus nilssonii]|uniref:Uncharacterized protein n=1 Tax=Cnephaeus nilssonii TaxID=3371016 RepID=A0AA40I6W6_CNENI|nr:LOW QUALITY PROTEIN: hypothetical protein QTO34_014729 [Eptesicus nilssonii]